MKAISIRQPWAWAIVHLGKRVENRPNWAGCNYRGELLIHAAQGMGTVTEFDEAVGSLCASPVDARRVLRAVADEEPRGRRRYRPAAALERGGIVGRTRVVDVIRDAKSFEAWASKNSDHEGQRRWWMGGFAIVLGDVEPVPFRPCKGELGLFEVP